LLKDFDFLECQEEETQRKYKISYNIKNESADIDLIRHTLIKKKIKANLIITTEIFGHSSDKGEQGKSIRYLSYRWNIPHDSILVAGDVGQ
jgi:hypothetical protein